MAIRQVITFHVKPGSGAEFQAGFAPIVAAVQREPGCEHYELFVSTTAPDTYVMIERWRDLAALQEALKKLHKGTDDPAVAFLKLIEGAPVRERYEV